jgi:hypothetical protein
MAERRRQGLYYNCDEQYVPGHRCARLFFIELDDFAAEDAPLEEDLEIPHISLHAITGLWSIRVTDTVQLRVVIGTHTFIALLDTGSTHSFIDSSALDALGLQPETRPGLRVMVANGDKLTSAGLCRSIPLSIDGCHFCVDCFALPLGGFDLVLGVDWLRTLGAILWDFNSHSVTIVLSGSEVTWTGLAVPALPVVRMITSVDSSLMGDMLDEFTDLFATSTGLPPARSRDHRIRLLPDTAPVAVRPYRYAQLQKDELERQCTEMLAQGIIRHSDSAFSSPVLLVKK